MPMGGFFNLKGRLFITQWDLATRITEVCNSVPREHLKAFVQHSINVFEKCLKGEPI